jgi:hypothetical protein
VREHLPRHLAASSVRHIEFGRIVSAELRDQFQEFGVGVGLLGGHGAYSK